MQHHTFRKLFYTALLLSILSGCEWADNLGKKMPVMGDRCENWQCFTESGRQASEAKKMQQQQVQQPQNQAMPDITAPSQLSPQPVQATEGMPQANEKYQP